MRQTFVKRVVLLACALFALTRVEPAFANPIGGVVTGGSATITTTTPTTVHIAQHSDRAVIDWRGFDIGATETTEFVQPTAGSIALNRVNSTSASQIDGKITANGNVVIINQNGVVFGSGSQVDANSLVVSTADTDNNTFMAGGKLALNKASSNPNAAIINKGTLTAKEAGLVGLVAPDVENQGVITARLGRAQLASGDTATVDLYGDGLLEVAVSDQVTKQLVKNTGTISADGGVIALTAAAGRNILSSSIQAGGTLQAQTVSSKQGAIIIASASSDSMKTRNVAATVIVTAKLNASGKRAGEKGGSIQVLGDNIALLNGTLLDASGLAGGGEILVGGDYHGGLYRGDLMTPTDALAWGNTKGGYSAINGTPTGSYLASLYTSGQVPTASRVFVDSGVRLLADSTGAGNGGRVIVWSNDGTVFNGFADVGAYGVSGNGGFIETSGEAYLQLAGSVNARAANGVAGTWLLDPADLTISNSADSLITAASPFQSTGGATSNLSVTTLVNALNGAANVIISSAAGAGGLGNVTFADAVAWNSIYSLTVNASNNIAVNNTITNSGTGDINLNANVASTGSIAINSAISTGGAINLLANQDITVGAGLNGNSLSLKAANGVTSGTGSLNLTGNLTLGTGSLTLVSGINGTRPSWTMDATTLSHSGSFGGPIDIEGFNTLTINRPLALTTGNNLLLANNTLIKLNNNLSTLGAGTISLNGPVVLPEAAAVSITTGGGNVTFGSTVAGTAGGVAETLNVNSGSGTTTFTGALNGFDPTVTAGTISLGSTLGATTTMGAVVLNSVNALNLPNVTATSFTATTTGSTADIAVNGNITSTGVVIITAFRDLTEAAGKTITAGGTGTLTLKAANGAVAGTGNLNLNGILNQNGTGGVTLYSGINGTRPNWTADTGTLVHTGSFGGAVDIEGFNTLTINRSLALTTGNNLTLTNNTATTLNGNLSTLGAGTITVNGPVTLPEAAAVTITTGNGAVSFGGTVSGTAGGVAETLNVNSGTGTTTFTGALNGFDPTVTAGTISFGSTLGATTTMGAVALTAANALTLPDITANSVNITTTGTTADIAVNGNITSAGDVVIKAFRDLTLAAGKTIASGTTGNLSLKAANGVTTGTGNLNLNGNLNIGTGNLTLYSGINGTRPSWTPTTTNLVHTGAFNGAVDIEGFNVLTLTRAFDLTANNNLTIANNTSTVLGVNLDTLGTGTITVSNPMTIQAGAVVSITTANQPIILGAITGGSAASSLTTNSGTGNTTFGGALNNFILNASANGLTFGGTLGSTTTMGGVTINSVNALTLPDITASSVNITTTGATGDVAVNGNITSAGGVVITAFRDLTLAAAKTITAGGAGALNLEAANGVTTGTGNLNLNGNLNIGTGALTLYSGINGTRPSWTATTTTLVHAGSFSGPIDIEGFNNLTLSRAIAMVANNNLSFNNNTTLTLGAGLSTLGSGTITLNNPVIIAAGTSVTISTVNQPITFGGTVTGGSATSSLTTTSGTATTNFGGNLNNFILNATADTITFGGTLGATTTMGAVTLSAVQALTLPDITAASFTATTTGTSGDINANGNITSAGAVVMTAFRDLTEATGKTIKAAGSGALTLKAANGVTSGTGNLNINGTLNQGGTGGVTLYSGINGTRPSLTLTTTNLAHTGSFGGGIDIEGFNTLTINRPFVLTAGNILIANNTTASIDSSALTAAGTGTITISNPLVLLEAAAPTFTTANATITLGGLVACTPGGVTEVLTTNSGTAATSYSGGMDGITLTGTAGSFTIGTLGAGTPMVNVTLTSAGALTLPDITLSGNLIVTTSTAASGNVTANGNITSSGGNISIVSVRDITEAAGKTIASGPAGSITLEAANNVVTGTGNLTLNGNLSAGTGALTLLSGINGTRPTWTANTTTLVQQGATLGAVNITGFGTITLNRDITSSGNITITSYGDLTLNAANTITNGAAGSMTLNAGGGIISGTGNLNLNGNINAGSGAITLLSGINGTRPTYTMGTTNFTSQGATFGAVTISGFQDFTINRNLTSSGNISIISQRDLTLNSGMTVTPGTAGGLTLQAANAVTTGTGNLTLNGILAPGTGTTTLTSGINGTRPSYTMTSSNWTPQGAVVGSVTITGFLDTTISTNVTSNSNVVIVSFRDLTVSAGYTLASGSAGGLALEAANNVVAGTGNLNINGTISNGTNVLTLLSGINGTRPSLTLTTSNLIQQGATMGAITISGFQDLTISRNLTSSSNISIVTQRDLTASATYTITPGSGSSLTLEAANNVVAGTGNLNLNGILAPGSSLVTLTSGINGTRPSYTMTTTNWLPQGATIGSLSVNGFQDFTVSRNVVSNGNIGIVSQRDLTLNAGYTLTSGAAGYINLKAANGLITGTGNLNILGNISIGTGALGLYSGINGARPSYDMTTSNYVQQATTVGVVDIQGFQDFSLDANMTSSGSVNIISQRDLNINSGHTLTTGAAGGLILEAANNNINGTGNLNIIGNLAVGTGAFTLTSGINGTRPSYSPTSTSLVQLGASFGPINWQGFATLTLGTPIVSSGTINFGNAVNILSSDITSSGAITFPNATAIAEGKTIHITSTNNNITFSNTLDGTAGGVTENVILNSGTGTVLFTSAVGSTVPLGNISVTADNLTLSSTIAGTGTLTLAPSTAGRAVNIGTATTDADTTAGFNLTSAEDGRIVDGWSQIVIGSTAAGTLTNNYATYTDPVKFLTGVDYVNAVAITDTDPIIVQALRDVVLNQSITTGNTGANALTLVAGRNFVNNAGASALTTGAGGRWLVYSTNPTANTGIASLSNTFNRYTCTYGGSCPALGTGNGLLYTYTPLLTITISGQTYNFGDAVIVPSGYVLQTSGYLNPLDNSNDTITGTGTFQTSYVQGQNAGTGYVISNNGSTLTSATGYGFTYVSNNSGIVGTRAITVSAADQAKTYGFGSLGTTGFSVTGGSLYGTDTINGVALATNASAATSGQYNISAPGTPWTISASGATFSSGLASNYAVTYANAATGLTITPKALTVTASGINKVYDGLMGASVTLGDNRISGDSLTLGYGAASFSDKNAANGKTVSVSGITVGGTDSGNYTFTTTASTTANITKAALTVTASGINKVYDGLMGASVTLGDNRISGDVLTLGYGAASFSDKNAANGKAVGVTGITVGGTDSGNYTFTTTASTTANITKAALTVTAAGINKVYDGLMGASVTLGDNRISGDVLTLGYGAASFSDKNAANGKAVGVTGITVGGTDNGNYTFTTTASTTANITKAALTVTAAGINKVYDGLMGASVTLGDNRISGDVLTLGYGAASFSDKNAANGKAVGVTGITVGGTDSGNYTFTTTASTTANITKAALTVTAAGINKVYDGLTDATVTLGDNRISGDVLTLGYGAASFSDKNAANGKAVGVTGITVGGTDSGNYTFTTTASTTANITKAALTVTASGINKVYDGLMGASVTLGDNRISGDVLTLGYGAASFSDKNAANGKTVSVSGITVGGTDSGNYTFTTTASTTANITKAALTVTASGINKVYDGLMGASVTLGDNRISGDSLTLGYGAASFSDKNAANGKTVSVSGITVGGTDSGNYTFTTTASTTANITKAALTVTASGINKVYDGLMGASVTLGDNRISGDVLTLGYGAASFSDKNAANGKAVGVTGITVGGTDNGNYTFTTTASTTANITKAALTVTAAGINKVYDGLMGASVTLGDNRISGDVLTLGYGAASFSDKNAANGKAVSVTGITVGGTDSGNYTFTTTASTTANITKAALTVTASGINKVYDGLMGASVTLGDNRISGDVLTLGYGAASFSDKNAANGKAVGVTGITVGGTDSGNYTFTTTASTTANITKAALTVTAAGINKVYDGLTDASVTLGDNRISGDVLTLGYGAASFSDKNAANGKAVGVTGITVGGTDSGNYTFTTTASTTANITKAALTVTASGINKVYDGLMGASVTLGDNRISGDVLTLGYGAASFSDKNAANGKAVGVTGITVGGTDSGNYTFTTTASTTANITKAALTVTAAGINKVYDGLMGASVTLGDNRISGDVLTLGYGAASFSDKNAANGKTVSVSGITVGGTDSGNYTFTTTASTTANITKAALTVTASGINKVYDGLMGASVTLGDNRISGDVLTLGYGAASFSDKNAANGKAVGVTGITVGGTDNGNYTFTTTASTTANITKAALTVTAAGINKVYDGLMGASVTLGDNRISGDVLTLGYGAASFSDKNAANGKAVSVTGITVGGTDSGNYTFTTTASTTANITKAALTVTAAGINKVYDGLMGASVTLGDNRISGDVLTLGYGAASFSDKNAANGKAVSVTGITVGGTDSGNYTFTTTASTTANITKAALTVTAAGINKVYDGLTDASVTLGDNRISGDVLTLGYGAASFSDKNAANGKAVGVTGITVGGTDSGNYTFTTTASTTANITKAALTVTASGVDKYYDGTTDATVTLGDNGVSGDSLTLGYSSASYANAAIGSNTPITVNGITVTGVDSVNYSFNTSTTTFGNILDPSVVPPIPPAPPTPTPVMQLVPSSVQQVSQNQIVLYGDTRHYSLSYQEPDSDDFQSTRSFYLPLNESWPDDRPEDNIPPLLYEGAEEI